MTEYGKARRQLLDFLERDKNLRGVDGELPTDAEAGGVLILEFTVPKGINIDVYRNGVACEATKYNDEGTAVGSKMFDSKDPLPVHSMISVHNWEENPYQHILGVSYFETGADGNFTYACSFGQNTPEEVGKLVIRNSTVRTPGTSPALSSSRRSE